MLLTREQAARIANDLDDREDAEGAIVNESTSGAGNLIVTYHTAAGAVAAGPFLLHPDGERDPFLLHVADTGSGSSQTDRRPSSPTTKGYDLSDPKHSRWHDTMSAIYDNREKI